MNPSFSMNRTAPKWLSGPQVDHPPWRLADEVPAPAAGQVLADLQGAERDLPVRVRLDQVAAAVPDDVPALGRSLLRAQ